MNLDLNQVPTPCYICNKDRLKNNLAILKEVQEESGSQILLALKGFAMFSVFPLMRKILAGTAVSSLHEARLGYEEFGGMNHYYAPAYLDREFGQILRYCDHLVFNSFSQWKYFRTKILESGQTVQCGIRINPEFSNVEKDLYNPCVKFSRLGVVAKEFIKNEMEGISGLHFHTHCASDADELQRTLQVVEKKFGDLLHRFEWINFGGGHQITALHYDRNKLIALIRDFRKKYDVKVFLELGEAIVLNAGIFVARVLDIIKNEIDIAILDCSATAHMPDTLEMPYRPDVLGAAAPEAHHFHYRLAGITCLAGDIIGDYYFEQPLNIGDRVVFEDMLHYTMVKNTTFNGVGLPTIASYSEREGFEIIKTFDFDDYKNRLS